MTRYEPSRNYFLLAGLALALGGFSGWVATRWYLAAIPAGVFAALGLLNLFLALRPTIEVRNGGITVGRRHIPWHEIAHVQRTGWISPLILWLILRDGDRKLLIYPGALDGSRRLFEDLSRRLARTWEEGYIPPRDSRGAPIPMKGPLLSSEDEADVERLFQRLKTVGHLEPNSTDEK